MKSCNLAAHPASRFPIHACVLFFSPCPYRWTCTLTPCLPYYRLKEMSKTKSKAGASSVSMHKKATFPIGSITMSSCSPDTQSHTAEKALSSPVASHLPYAHFIFQVIITGLASYQDTWPFLLSTTQSCICAACS